MKTNILGNNSGRSRKCNIGEKKQLHVPHS